MGRVCGFGNPFLAKTSEFGRFLPQTCLFGEKTLELHVVPSLLGSANPWREPSCELAALPLQQHSELGPDRVVGELRPV
jgi:hypothetical protein